LDHLTLYYVTLSYIMLYLEGVQKLGVDFLTEI
jgi:hypothetical protein